MNEEVLKNICSWPVITVSFISFLVLYRHFGGFYFRSFVAVLTILIMSIYGFLISLVLPLIKCTHLINYSVARGCYYLGGFFTGLSVVSEGEENLNKVKGPVIYVCNHQSSLDIMLMGKVYPKNTVVVAKKELKYYPFLGWFMTLSNAIFLDRKNRNDAIKNAKKAAEDIHNKKTNVWIFPEGTRGHETEITLLPFKKGAFYMAVQARVPIVPVVIANYSGYYSTKQKKFTGGIVRCRVLPPIPTENVGESSADVEKLANECRDKMLVALKDITPVPQKKSELKQ